MSYVEHGSRVFMDAGDLPMVLPKRSEGRMKTYPSATDARAWCPYTDDRRQHILDLIRADHEKCAVGKYVPIEVLIDTLLSSKNADIAKLREQVEELQGLLDIYAKLDLTEDQKRTLGDLQRSIGKVGDKLGGIEKGSPRGSGITSQGTFRKAEDDSETTDATDSPREQAESDDAQKSMTTDTPRVCAAMKGIGPALSLDGYSPSELKDLVIQKDAEVIALKNALAAKTAECNQQNEIAQKAVGKLENLRDIMDERDSLQDQLEASIHEIENLRSRVEDPCHEEIRALEQDLERLQANGQLTQEEEVEFIRKELEVLKKHCARLGQIGEDYNKLARELKQIRELEGIPYEGEEIVPPEDIDDLRNGYISLAQKVSKLATVMNDRDNALRKIHELESELMKYEGLPQQLENFRQKSEILDEVLDERENLIARLKATEGLNEELLALKEKADRVDELEKLLKGSNTEKREGCRDLENIKKERDTMKVNLAVAEEEMEQLRYKAKETEGLRIERDRLKIRMEELSMIEGEFMRLLDKTRCLETIKAEREMYKTKYEELLGLECECDMLRAQIKHFQELDLERQNLQQQVEDCECCITEQEDEIKRLVGHIDRLSQGSSQQKDRMQKALSDMRVELDDKSCLIASSEEQLACVQEQLKSTIAGVTCETTCLRARIEDLESEVEYLHSQLRERTAEICILKETVQEKDSMVHTLHREKMSVLEMQEQSIAQLEAEREELEAERRTSASLKDTVSSKEEIISNLQNELEERNVENERLHSIVSQAESFKGDQHAEELFTESKSAVQEVAIELAIQYQDWDCMQERLKQWEEEKAAESRDQSIVTDATAEKSRGTETEEGEDKDAKIRKLEARIKELEELTQRLTAEAKATGKGQETEAENLNAKIRQLEAKNKELEDKLSNADRVAAENTALRRHSAEVQDLAKEQIAELAEKLKAAHERIAQLESCINDGNLKANKSMLEVDALRAQLEEEKKLRTEAEKKVNQMTSSLKDRDTQSSKNEAGLQSEINRLNSENEELKQLLKSMSDSSQKRTSQADKEIKAMSDQHAQCLKEKAKLEAENANLKKEISDLLQKVSTVTTGVDASKDFERERKEKEDLEKLVANLQNQINGMQSGSDDIIAKLQAQLKQEQTKTSATQTALDRLKSELQEEQAKTSATQTALDKLKSEIPKTEGATAELLAEIDNLKRKVKLLEAENSQLKSDLSVSKRVSDSEAADHKQVVAAYESRLRASMSSLEALEASLSEKDKARLQKMKKDYEDRIASLEGTIATLKAQYEKDLKAMQNKYNDGIAKLQSSHEDVLKEIGGVYESQLDTLRDELRNSKGELIKQKKSSISKSVDTEKRSSLTPATVENVNIKPFCICGNTLEAVLNKILKNGIETLTFEELQLLHTKTCDATAKLLATCPGTAPCSPRRPCMLPATQSPRATSITPQTPSSALTCMDQLMMMKTISGLENDLLRKQQIAENKISILQKAVKTERHRLEELKETLDEEKLLNSELLNKIGLQSHAVDKIQKEHSFHEDQILELVTHSRSLEESLSKERGYCKQLRGVLDGERHKQRKDMETLKLKLEKSLNSELALRLQLEQRSKSNRVVCPCKTSGRDSLSEQPTSQTTTTFYTELTIQDNRKKQNFVHHCSKKQLEDSTPESSQQCVNSSGPRRTSSSSARQYSQSSLD